MSTVAQSFASPRPVVEEPRVELGWQEVGSGLLRIVLGYSLSFIALVGGIGLILLVTPLHDGEETFLQVKRNYAELIALAGFGVMGIAGMVSYAWIMVGKWRCLMNAPERQHAKWLMFAAMTCLAMGPALGGMSASLGGAARLDPRDLDEKPVAASKAKSHAGRGHSKGFVEGTSEHLTIRDTSGILNLASGAIGLLSGVLFLLFLRAVARCFEDEARVRLVEMYLGFSLLLGGGSFFLLLSQPKLTMNGSFLLALAGAWLLEFILFLVVILAVRGTIVRGLQNQPAPLGA